MERISAAAARLVVEDTNGVSDFDSLPSAIRYKPDRLVFYAFDLLHLGGQDLRQRELLERRAILSEIIKPVFAIRYSEHFEGDGAAFFAAAVKHGLEGIVSKRAHVGREGSAGLHYAGMAFMTFGEKGSSAGRICRRQ